jgi:hypothetical protein
MYNDHKPSFPFCQTGDAPISYLDPHYSDRQFRDPRSVWAKDKSKLARGEFGCDAYNEPGIYYDYSDRLEEWHSYEKITAARKAAEAAGYQPRTAPYLEAFIRALLDAPNLEILHIVAGVNHSNGYSYLIYGYRSNTLVVGDQP